MPTKLVSAHLGGIFVPQAGAKTMTGQFRVVTKSVYNPGHSTLGSYIPCNHPILLAFLNNFLIEIYLGMLKDVLFVGGRCDCHVPFV